MRLINCRIKINEYQDVAKINVTPAEAMLLMRLHNHAAGGQCIINPVAAGEVERSNEEELMRLRMKYQARSKSGEQGTHLVDDIFPGLNPDLPQTFDHPKVGLQVAPPVEKLPEMPEGGLIPSEHVISTPNDDSPASADSATDEDSAGADQPAEPDPKPRKRRVRTAEVAKE